MTPAALRDAELTVLGQVPGASNAVFLCLLEGRGENGPSVRRGIYKPVRGERPLHDFEPGSLARREVAAFRLADALGIDSVPPTVYLDDGPFGPGSLQAYVLSDEPEAEPVAVCPPDRVPTGHVPVLRGEGEDGEELVVAHSADDAMLRLAAFDAAANNADRKGSHILFGTCEPGSPSRIFGIDNGLSFHTDPKLRTVLWGFAGRPLPEDLSGALARLADEVPAEVAELLRPEETAALARRAESLVDGGRMTDVPRDRYPIPWPPV